MNGMKKKSNDDAGTSSAEVKEWLGTSNTMEEAIDVIKEIANKTYTVSSLRSDIIEYFHDKESKYLGEI